MVKILKYLPEGRRRHYPIIPQAYTPARCHFCTGQFIESRGIFHCRFAARVPGGGAIGSNLKNNRIAISGRFPGSAFMQL
jgi:hypothetical protein